MIKTENVSVWGLEHAIRGMRNPMNSWDKSDSTKGDTSEGFVLGQNDLELMQKLCKAGVEHRTFLRLIQVSMDITAPLYWWKEMDRYTVGKSQVSTSTMHKITSKEFTFRDFSNEQMQSLQYDDYNTIFSCWYKLIETLNLLREKYNETKEKVYWYQIIQMLPESYNQKRTVVMSYEVVFKIINERSGHKLVEWLAFVENLKTLPYVSEIMEIKN